MIEITITLQHLLQSTKHALSFLSDTHTWFLMLLIYFNNHILDGTQMSSKSGKLKASNE